MTESTSLYRTHLYTPDMTILIKELKYDDTLNMY